MQFIRKNGATSNTFRVTLRNSSTGQGLTGLTFSSSGLIISTICDNEPTATAYTAAGSTIETISSLGTFATPTSTKCRFKEVDATNHPGDYEIQLADARFAVSSAKILRLTISGATNLLAKTVVIQLTTGDKLDTANPTADLDTIKTQSVTNAAGVTFGAFVGNATAALSVDASGFMKLAPAQGPVTFTGTAASGSTPATAGLTLVGGAASTTSGGAAGPGLKLTGGAGAATNNGAGAGFTSTGGGTTTVSGGEGVVFASTGTKDGLKITGMLEVTDGLAISASTTNRDAVSMTGNGQGVGCFIKSGASAGAALRIQMNTSGGVTAGAVIDIIGTGTTNGISISGGNNSGIVFSIGSNPGIDIGAGVYVLKGNINGNLVGDVGGNVDGDLFGNVDGNLLGNVGGDLQGTLSATAVSAIWNALATGITTVGSIGKRILDYLGGGSKVAATVAAGDGADAATLAGRLTTGRAAAIDNLDAMISSRSTYAGADTPGTTTLLGRVTAARAGYWDALNISGPVASHADFLAINTSSSKHVLLTTVGQYERPESGNTVYTVEARTFSAVDGTAVNADSTPTMAVVGQTSGSLAANLSAATNPATGVYRWTYTVVSNAVTEPIRFDVSAVISSATFTLSCHTQVVDEVSQTWTATNAAQLAAIFNKLPSRSFIAGTTNSTGQLLTTDVENPVWDAAFASHQIAGSTGLILNNTDYLFDPFFGIAVDSLTGLIKTNVIDINGVAGQQSIRAAIGMTTASYNADITHLGSPMQAGAHVQLATSQDQYAPAKVGDAMTLSAAYDAAKAAASATALAAVAASIDDIPTNAELAASQATADDATIAAIGALNNISTTQVKAEADLALSDVGVTTVRMGALTDWLEGGRLDNLLDSIVAEMVTAVGEPGQGAPPVTASRGVKIDYLYKMWRNKKTEDGSQQSVYNDAGNVVDQKSTTTDNGTVLTVGEVVSGP